MKDVILGMLMMGLVVSGAGADEGQWSSDKIEAVIWEREMAIFEGRSRGDISNYLGVTSSAYLGWPPGFPEPLPLADFKAGADIAKGLAGEVTSVERQGYTRFGETALTYFLTHRTRLGEGMAPADERDVDQYYENIHVWTLENGQWRLIGGMARPVVGDPPA